MDERELAFAGVARQAALVREREVSPRELVELYLRRIERLDPQLNAFRTVYAEQALADAKAAGRRTRAKAPPPLLGVPVAIKDNVDVAGDVTTHGTSAHGGPAAEDSEQVRRVREAGAILLGRTNVPPLCALCVTESSTFGVSRNPWDTDRSPGGSSGGSGAAVAAGLVGAASGSDGGGSIRVPAAFCGLVGLKPQRGRVSTAPLPEHWHGMTAWGWLARSVADAALMLDATAGSTANDRARPPAPPRPYAEAAASPPGRLRVAWSVKVPPGALGVPKRGDVRGAVTETAELLGSLGHEVAEADPEYHPSTIPSIATRVLRGVADEAKMLPRFDRLDRRFRQWTRLGSLISDSALAKARAAEAADARRIGALFDRFDVVITPVTSEPAIETGRWEGLGAVRTFNGMVKVIPWPGIWNHTGQPAIAVPAGATDDGLPLAVQIVGRPNDEGTLLSLAAQIETERPWADRLPPVS
jgi:amidase